MININKREIPPPSLAVQKELPNGSYTGEDVIVALVEDSHNKCYLCEDSLITTINVEHFTEHRGNLDLKFDWHNLHYACGHCNATKNDTFRRIPSNLLNCTNPTCDVDLWIISRMVDEDLKSEVKISRNTKADIEVIFQSQVDNTVMLLDRIFNGTGTAIRNQEAFNLRQRVLKELVPFNEMLMEYLLSSDPEVKDALKKDLLSKISEYEPFISFKRWILRDVGIAADFDIATAT